MTPDQVPGLISEDIGNKLSWLAALVPSDQIIVEIGAFKGRSTCYLATGSAHGNDARVISIDPWDDPDNTSGPKAKGPIYIDPANKQQQRAHLIACGVDHLVTSIQGYSWDVDLPTEPVGLLWVDGAHDQESVQRDIDRWTPLVASGGYIAFDDYGAKCPGVDRAVDKLMEQDGWTEWDTSIQSLAVGRKL